MCKDVDDRLVCLHDRPSVIENVHGCHLYYVAFAEGFFSDVKLLEVCFNVHHLRFNILCSLAGLCALMRGVKRVVVCFRFGLSRSLCLKM